MCLESLNIIDTFVNVYYKFWATGVLESSPVQCVTCSSSPYACRKISSVYFVNLNRISIHLASS